MPFLLVIATNFTSTFVTGAVLGAVLLVVGVVLGLVLAFAVYRPSPVNDAQTQASQSLAVMHALAAFTQGFKGDLSRHHEMISGLAEQFEHNSEDAPCGDAGSLLVKKITEANRALQERLDTAEATLELQASELQSYMSKAHTDTLTSLPNRRAFDEEMEKRLAAWNRYGTPVSLVLLDIDHFKKFNDTHGHLAGDFVLSQVASVLRSYVRGSDIVARYGGEEFVAILPETELNDAGVVGVSLLQAVRSTTFDYQGKTLAVTISVGVAAAVEGDKPGDIISRADKALYESKRCGRDQGHFLHGGAFTPLSDAARSVRETPAGRENRAAEIEAARNIAEPLPQRNIIEVCDELRQRFLEVTQHQ